MSHYDIAHIQPPTNVNTKYQLPTLYGFRDITADKLKVTTAKSKVKSRSHHDAVFALEHDFSSWYTLWGELSQNHFTNASVLSLPGETLKTD